MAIEGGISHHTPYCRLLVLLEERSVPLRSLRGVLGGGEMLHITKKKVAFESVGTCHSTAPRHEGTGNIDRMAGLKGCQSYVRSAKRFAGLLAWQCLMREVFRQSSSCKHTANSRKAKLPKAPYFSAVFSSTRNRQRTKAPDNGIRRGTRLRTAMVNHRTGEMDVTAAGRPRRVRTRQGRRSCMTKARRSLV
jgi:hypothetical protein